MLLEIVQSAKCGNAEDMLAVLEKFCPLLKKYARMLNYEDAFAELQIGLIEIVHVMPLPAVDGSGAEGSIVSYIAHSVHNLYVKLSIKQQTRQEREFELDGMTIYAVRRLEASLAIPGNDDILDFWGIIPMGILTKNERIVLKKIYYDGYSAAEIARQVGTTRQNVNQLKRKALRKLREALI